MTKANRDADNQTTIDLFNAFAERLMQNIVTITQNATTSLERTAAVESSISDIKSMLAGMSERIDAVNEALVGNVKSGSAGLLTRTDRLEQVLKTVTVTLTIVAGSMLPVLFNSCSQSNAIKKTDAQITMLEGATAISTSTPYRDTDVPSHTPTCTPTLTATLTPTAKFSAGFREDDREALAALCWVECRGMGNKRAECCASVADTVHERIAQATLTDGTVIGTLRWGCDEDTKACQFPAYVTQGCAGIVAPCPFDDPAGLGIFWNVIGLYFDKALSPTCSHYLYYGLKPFDEPECIIENAENGQFVSFHN